MMEHYLDDAKFSTATTSSSCPSSSQFPTHTLSNRNVLRLLAWREVSPRAKHSPKKLWAEAEKQRVKITGRKLQTVDARDALISWVESESLRHLSAKYCPLLPPPRSTIAAAFSADGKTLASTHGDHTVKIIDCRTGSCLKVLSGHRRTPWVVRFHPVYPEILASGSLDHDVRIWDARTADCLGSHDFHRPIASIAFHAQGELLAVASGHKLYVWNYNKRGEATSPSIVLKTRRSLRAVHFHPHAAPFLLTAEVNDLDSPDSPLTPATSSGYLQYPLPAVFFANVNSGLREYLETKMPLIPSPYFLWPTFVRDDGRSSLQLAGRASGFINGQQQQAEPSLSTQQQMFSGGEGQTDNIVTPMEISSEDPSGTTNQPISSGLQNRRSTGIMERSDIGNNVLVPTFQANGMTGRLPLSQSRPGALHPPSSADLQKLLRNVEGGQLHEFIPVSDPVCWDLHLPFLQGWFMGQTHAGLNTMPPANGGLQGNFSVARGAGSEFLPSNLPLATSAITNMNGQSRVSSRPSSRHRSRSRVIAPVASGDDGSFANVQSGENENIPIPFPSIIESEISTAAAAAEVPCTVKLRIWPHSMQNPCASLDPETCRLTIPHTVLCSEMGAHFSPCGRFLVACVACMLPHVEGDPGLQFQMHLDATGAATSPTRHPCPAQQVMYELRLYSLEEATFGSVLASRAIRAAHCLTSIQFSPTSEHILLAYGRRHSSLLRSIVIDGENEIPIYTILEVYRVSDMELVRVLPSAEDEVNVACFHPLVGGGLVYGTKEGKLRILQFDGSLDTDCTAPNHSLEENMVET